MNDSKKIAAFMRVHKGLPRQAPGSDKVTAQILESESNFKEAGTVLDVGCGPGRSALILAKSLKSKVIAVDLCEEFLLELKEKVERENLEDLIEVRQSDMTTLDLLPKSVDLIWAEGSIYIAGFDKALKSWRSFLTDKGSIVCSELSWLGEERSEPASRFFGDMYPAMRTVSENRRAAEAIGYRCINHVILPETAWWDEYYLPMMARIEELEEEAKNDPALADAIGGARQEIEMYRQYSNEYGYVFYILQKSLFRIEEAKADDIGEVARVFRTSFRKHLPFIEELHSADEDNRYFKEVIFPNNTVVVARDENSRIVGMIAYDLKMINQFYLLPDYTNLGLGSRMLAIVKSERDSIKLWTFQRNEIAKKFYAKHGFQKIKETDGKQNEEKEPDLLLAWSK